MCSHKMVNVGGVKVCLKCGMTVLSDGSIYFDRKLPNYKSKRRRKDEKRIAGKK